MSRLYRSRPVRSRRWRITRVAVIAFLVFALCLLGYQLNSVNSANMEAQAEKAIAQTVTDSAVQCFSIEGSYPSDLSYLEDNYGLQINHRDYYVTYETFGSNVMPSVRVMRRR
jgi:uncharacterized protein YabE (DUF348 family)